MKYLTRTDQIPFGTSLQKLLVRLGFKYTLKNRIMLSLQHFIHILNDSCVGRRDDVIHKCSHGCKIEALSW